MPNIRESIDTGAKVLAESGIADPRREAASLLTIAIGKDRTFLFAHPEYQLSTVEQRNYDEFLTRRAGREPLQYIRGTQEFYGLEFEVTPDVLIPRPETEMLVEHSIAILREIESPHFCEVGVGSGCISISIVNNVADAKAIGLDISDKALAVAQQNARKIGVEDRLALRRSDIFSALTDEKFDLIVSNPPYISRDDLDNLQPEVRDFEPLGALTDGSDGFSVVAAIVRESPNFLKTGGYLLIEIGAGQADRVHAMFDPAIWGEAEILPDFQAIPRMVGARLISGRNF